MASLRVMTWNVQNLFEAGSDDGPTDLAAFTDKVTALAAVIDALRPDVAVLQEVGQDAALAALQNALNHRMPHRIVGVADGRGIRVAMLSTRLLRNRHDITAFPVGLAPVQNGDPGAGGGVPTIAAMKRPGLEASIRIAGQTVTIVGVHLKSKLLTFPGGRFSPANGDERARFGAYALYQRTSEVATVRSHLNGLLAGSGGERKVVLAGDMNDELSAATTQILNGPPGSEIGTVGFGRPDDGDGDRMWNLAPLIPELRRWSRMYRGRGELIDHIFASLALARDAPVAGRVIVDTATATIQLPSIDDDPNALRDFAGSDHAAVVATFQL